MTVNCDRCCTYIEADNPRWPGCCSADCRNLDRADRDRRAAVPAEWLRSRVPRERA